jgi:hypothetical protein
MEFILTFYSETEEGKGVCFNTETQKETEIIEDKLF